MSVYYQQWLVYFVGRQGVGLSERESLAFLRFVFLKNLSEVWILSLVNCLVNAFAISVSEVMASEPKLIGCLPTSGLDPFKERTTSQNFLALVR